MPADVGKVLGHQELKQQNLYRALAAECLGTLLLNFYGVISCVKTNSLKNDLVEVSLTFGLVVFAVVQVGDSPRFIAFALRTLGSLVRIPLGS